MENWKVREVSADPEKSTAEIEKELVEKAEAKFTEGEESPTEEVSEEKIDDKSTSQEVPVTDESIPPQLNEEQVLSFLKNRYDKEINTLDDLVNTKTEEMPQEVSDYLTFKQNTGKSFDEFLKFNRDFDDIDDDSVLKEFYASTKKHLDSDDIEFELKNKFGYDDEIDADDTVRKIKISKKEEVLKARQYFKDRKDEYLKPVESTKIEAPIVTNEPNQSTDKVNVKEEAEKRMNHFTKKTEEYFNDTFNGFNFKIGDDVISYNTGDLGKVKTNHSDLNNFIKQHITEDGFLTDAEKYHKSLAAAFDPDGLAKFFYEKGKADAVTNDVKSTKNIDMGLRKAPVISSKGEFKVSAVKTNHGNSLKIRSNRNK